MRGLVESLQALEEQLRLGGGPKKIDKQHRDGKLTARERVAKLIDTGSMFLEIGLLIAFDQYEGQAPGAGVVTGLARIEGRPAVIVANDATVKAGAWWPETITKDPARAGDRDAQPPAHRVSGRFGGGEPARCRMVSSRASMARPASSTTIR